MISVQDDEQGLPSPALTELVVPRVGAVVNGRDATLPWLVVDRNGVEVPAAAEYLRHAVAVGLSAASVESYARALLRWLRPVDCTKSYR